MERKQQFLEWLRKDDWYTVGSADAALGRISGISTHIGKDVYALSSAEADLVRDKIVDGQLLANWKKHERDSFATALSRYSDFAKIYPAAISQ